MTTSRRHRGSVILGLGPILPLLVLASAACVKQSTYTYMDVQVMIDRQTVSANQLYKVTSCEFQVLGAETSATINLPCPENRVQYDVGTFQWTSGVSAGALQFQVTVYDANLVPIGQGTSDPVALSPGKHLATSVLVLGLETGTETDAGGDASQGSDGGVDAGRPDGITTADAASSDGASEQGGPDGGTGDGATDAAGDAGSADGGTIDVPPEDGSQDDGQTDAADAGTDGVPTEAGPDTSD